MIKNKKYGYGNNLLNISMVERNSLSLVPKCVSKTVFTG